LTGVLGGTFDPPHNGHLALAKGARQTFELQEIVFLLAAAPGHRKCVEDADMRERLAHAAFDDVPSSRVERDEHAFTVDAVCGGRFGDAIFLVGADEGEAFPNWKDPEGVLRWVKLGVGSRSGYAPPNLEQYGDRIAPFQFASPSISSSEIRRLLAAGEPIDGLVPARVADLIAELGLYGTGGDRG
jgi:nicotinate-nucleotide adenylyltransferase